MFSVAGIVLLAGMALPVQAGVIPPGNVSYTIDSRTPEFTDFAINDGRLSDGVVATTVGQNTTELEFANAYATGYNATAFPGYDTNIFTFNLGAAYDLSSVRVYYESSNGQGWVWGPASVDVALSSDGSTFGAASNFTGFSQVENRALADIIFDVSGVAGSSNAKYAKLTFHCGNTQPQNFMFLSEITFANAVPEPGTLALLAAGLVGLLAYAWRKRK